MKTLGHIRALPCVVAGTVDSPLHKQVARAHPLKATLRLLKVGVPKADRAECRLVRTCIEDYPERLSRLANADNTRVRRLEGDDLSLSLHGNALTA